MNRALDEGTVIEGWAKFSLKEPLVEKYNNQRVVTSELWRKKKFSTPQEMQMGDERAKISLWPHKSWKQGM